MANRLAAESSPYLLQHAENPVDWWPWCEEALALARSADKPILLSIGYSACHWCHVMAHESFEDPEVAEVMNRLFVNIKVDREERPDLDQIYQTAHQMLTRRSGGWPLTMMLTPDGMPFFGGTYFPKQARYGLPGFPELLERIAAAYLTQRAAIDEQNTALRGALDQAGAAPVHHSEFGPGPLVALRDLLSATFDERHGGFGDAPKFPHPTDLEFLLHRYRIAGDERARDIVLATLTHMAEGGLYDHLGGGFCRYSTDARWQIPHFEKMLYDNGALLGLYAQGWQISGSPLFRRVVEETAAWAVREMQAPGGAFYSALDADSEGEEGRFYVWDRKDVEHLLDPVTFALFSSHYGLEGPPNFEGRHWHLAVARPLDEVAEGLGVELEQAQRRLADARALLCAVRERRVRPGRDEKLLTSWNGLMISGLACAGRVFGREDWLDAAASALTFIQQQLWRDGRLFATSAGGPGRLNAYLDDHAFLIHALLELLQARFDVRWLAFAEDLADALLDDFEDSAGGGFFFTRHDHEALIQRPKPIHDGATASGNGVAVRMLARLAHLTGEHRYLEAAERAIQACYGAMQQSPAGCAAAALALAEQISPPAVVVLRGPAEELAHWQRTLAKYHRPDALIVAVSADAKPLPRPLDKPLEDRVNAWVCQGVRCLSPISDIAELERAFCHQLLYG